MTLLLTSLHTIEKSLKLKNANFFFEVSNLEWKVTGWLQEVRFAIKTGQPVRSNEDQYTVPGFRL